MNLEAILCINSDLNNPTLQNNDCIRWSNGIIALGPLIKKKPPLIVLGKEYEFIELRFNF